MRSKTVIGAQVSGTIVWLIVLLLAWAPAALAHPPHTTTPRPLAFAYSARDKTYLPIRVSFSVTAPRFVSGTIDMTGDGESETVRVVDGRLRIESGGIEVWRSEPDWQVVDAALGDPNNDGRFEALVAFLKPDAAGRLRSQPFIVGYRRGLFGTWWGGSPIERPLLEVELADVDGDGSQELLTIESVSDTEQRPAVWRWHGWGFSLQWVGPLGRYHGLLARDVTGDGVPDLVVADAS
jgi:hypothetical protein